MWRLMSERMSVNFCHPELQPKIFTSTVCTDGYGVDNLLNFNPFRGGWKGFMAESYIKPPIDITIEFPFNICIEKIILDPVVGRQKSSGFEIYSANIPTKQQHKNRDDSRTKPTPIFTRIGNTLLPWPSIGQNPCVLRFINTSYKSSFPDISSLSPQKQEVRSEGDVERFLRLAAPGAVENVNNLTIRITRSYGGSVLVLRRVEVWGEPSTRIPRQSQLWALENIRRLFTKNNVETKTVLKSAEQESSSSLLKNNKHSASTLSSATHDAGNEEGTECPDDFLDPITCQMMMLPVLLPSGHTIDRSTLDKHNKTEAVWGRPPNDPFTGVQFTSKSQPIPNVKLKTRLDQYMLTCSDNQKPVARDVGRSSNTGDISKPSASTLIISSAVTTKNREIEAKLKSRHDMPFVNLDTASKSSTTTKASFSTSRPSERVKITLNKQKRSAGARAGPLVKKTKLQDNTDAGSFQRMTGPSNMTSSPDTSKSHEESVTDSLDSALNQALGNLPSYSNTPRQSASVARNDLNHTISTSNASSPSCAVCHVAMKSTALNVDSKPAVSLYRLPCTHLICRACLVISGDKSAALNQEETRFCASCGRSYRREDVVRVHL